MVKIKDKYKKLFLVERKDKVTIFFLSKKEKSMDMKEFIETHYISDDIMNNYTNNVMDFYNDMIKFQNKEKQNLNHLTIFSYTEDEFTKYITDVENADDFVRWINIDDEKWLDKIRKYFLNDRWFETSDAQRHSS